VRSENYEVPHYAVSPTYSSLFSLTSKHSPQHPVFKHNRNVGMKLNIRSGNTYLVYKEVHDVLLMIEMRSVCTDPRHGPVGINHNLFLIRNLSSVRFILLLTSPEQSSTL
jgi:hypothetical protein